MPKIASLLRNSTFCAGMVLLLGVLLYVNTIPNEWAVDDGVIIHNSISVRRGISGIPAIFGSEAQKASTGQDIDAIAGGRYRPLTPAMYALLAQFVAHPELDKDGAPVRSRDGTVLRDLGSDTVFPHVAHLLNALLYGLLCLVLYRLLVYLLQERRSGTEIALLATTLFAVHPLHTEAVANVKGSDEIVALLLALLATRCALQAAASPRRRWAWLPGSAILFFLAALAKENALTFLLIIPLTIQFFRPVPFRRLAMHAAPLGIAAVLYLGLRLAAVGHLSLTPPDSLNMMNDPFLVVAEGQQFRPLVQGSDIMVLQHPSTASIVPMPQDQRLATVLYTWLTYLRLIIMPQPLCYDYYPRHIEVHSFADPAVLFSLLLHLALLILAWRGLRHRQLYAYGILFYAFRFAIVSNLFFPVGTNMAERFLFMPSAGICIALADGIARLRQRFSGWPVPALATLVLLLYSIRTVVRNNDWKDNLTLIQHDLNAAGNSAKIRSDFGEVVLNRIAGSNSSGNRAQNDGAAEDAADRDLLISSLPLYKEALDTYPMYGLVWFNLARTHQYLGSSISMPPNERLTHLTTALAAYGVTDTYKPIQYKKQIDTLRSLCFTSLGKLYGQEFGDLDVASHYLREAIRGNSRNAQAMFLLGTVCDMRGYPDSSYYFTKTAYDLDPLNSDYMENYALVLQKQVLAGRLPDRDLEMSSRLLQRLSETAATNPQETVRLERIRQLLRINDSLQMRVAAGHGTD